MRVWHKIGVTLEMIKWEHSVFALPFALTAAMLAASGWPRVHLLFWIVVCMVLARSAGMAFNRWADAELDARNPRTMMRAIPGGQLTRGFVGGFTVVTSILFLISAAQLNRLTLLLAPAELGLILLYSYTKRFTRWSHLVLGLVLGSTPAAAWMARPSGRMEEPASSDWYRQRILARAGLACCDVCNCALAHSPLRIGSARLGRSRHRRSPASLRTLDCVARRPDQNERRFFRNERRYLYCLFHIRCSGHSCKTNGSSSFEIR